MTPALPIDDSSRVPLSTTLAYDANVVPEVQEHHPSTDHAVVANPITPQQSRSDFGSTKEGKIVYELPKVILPPLSELEPIETFVCNAIQSQHEENADPTFAQGYRAIADSLRRPDDPAMLVNVLIALRTAGNGSALYHMATTSHQKHSLLTHLIFKFNSFDPPRAFQGASPMFVQPFTDYSMADAHLHLLLAFVSAKSVHVVPAMTAIWKLLAVSRQEAPEPM